MGWHLCSTLSRWYSCGAFSPLQTERAFQKQDAIFVGKFRTLAKKNKKDLRFVRNVGLGFKTPKEAIEVSCWLAAVLLCWRRLPFFQL